MLALLTTLMITFTQAAVSERNQSTFSLGAACVEELDWCKDPGNFVNLSNCDTSGPQYDPTKCQTVYERFAQNDCISRSLRNEKSACAGVQQSFDKTAAFILESSVACAAFSAATESCVSKMSVVNPDFDQVDDALKCLIAAAKDSKHQKNSQAKKCSRFERVFNGRRKLKGDISGSSFSGDNLLTGLCGCICPQDTCNGVYLCTHLEARIQSARCHVEESEEEPETRKLSAVPTMKPILSGETFHGHNADGLLAAQCGCCPGDDDCLGFYECNHAQRQAELALCAAKAASETVQELGSEASTVPAPTHTADGYNAYFCGCCGSEEQGSSTCIGIYRCGQAEFWDYIERCQVEVLTGPVEQPVPTARPTLAGSTFEGYDADGFYGALCGCICPQDTCKGVYQCTQGERQKQLAQCSAGSTIHHGSERRLSVPAAPTAQPILSGMTYKGHNADGLLTAQCGCCPGDDDCLGFYECNHAQRRAELAQCAARADTEPTARPTLAGQTFDGHNADGFFGALCGCICPEDDCAGLYVCTQGERAAQLAQCTGDGLQSAPANAEPTTQPILSGETFHGHNADGLLTAICGCCPGDDDCLGFYECNHAQRRAELAQCAARAKAAATPTPRPTLAGQIFDGYNADGLLTAECGCICPQDTCRGVYQCTHGERRKQLAQCPIPAPAPATANDIAYSIKEKITSVKSTGLPVDPLDTLISAVCGCICPEDDCMTLIPCTQGDYRRERRRCAAGPTRRLGENRLN